MMKPLFSKTLPPLLLNSTFTTEVIYGHMLTKTDLPPQVRAYEDNYKYLHIPRVQQTQYSCHHCIIRTYCIFHFSESFTITLQTKLIQLWILLTFLWNYLVTIMLFLYTCISFRYGFVWVISRLTIQRIFVP